MNKKYYFVYGTLKKGHGNHSLLKDCKKIGTYKSEPKFTMVNLGAFPGVLLNGSTSITGEIYEVESEHIENNLDRLEGYREGDPNSLYNKKIIKVNNKDCYIYIFNRKHSYLDNNVIKSGIWE